MVRKAVYGGTPEYWAWVKNGRVFVQRNYPGARTHEFERGGIIPLTPSPRLEDSEPVGFVEDPANFIA
nr:MAG: hypothetical protein DIU66_10550 [Bacillota bacterium]